MENSPNINSVQMGPGGFASTHWSVVLLAGGAGNAPEVQDALARLCSAYWYPLYVFIRRQGHSDADTEDLTQEFFARFIDKDFLSTVDHRRGKFRTFLLACCQHFLSNQRDFARPKSAAALGPPSHWIFIAQPSAMAPSLLQARPRKSV